MATTKITLDKVDIVEAIRLWAESKGYDVCTADVSLSTREEYIGQGHMEMKVAVVIAEVEIN